MNNKSVKTTGLLRLKTKIKIFLAVFSLLTVSVSLYTSAINENYSNPFFMNNDNIHSGYHSAGSESQIGETVQNNPPKTPVKPSGPTFVEMGVEYTYMTTTFDRDGDQIRYQFDWGDGTCSSWTDFASSNISVSMSHIWNVISDYHVRVLAQDINGSNSSWSSVINVVVSQIESIEPQSFLNESVDKDENSSWSQALNSTTSQAETREIPSFVDESVDNFEKFIWNSNGNYWKATGNNIQLAINDLDNNGAIYGTVFVPPGTFNITTRIYIKDGVWLKGAGKHLTVIRMSDHINRGSVVCSYYKSNWTISDLTIDGNNASNNAGVCIDLYSCRDFVIKDVRLKNAYSSALRLQHNCSRGFVTNVVAENIQEFHGLNLYDTYDSIFSDYVCKNIADGYALNLHSIVNCTFNNFITESAYGIKMLDTGVSGFPVNNCSFNNFDVYIINNSGSHEGLKLEDIVDCNFNNFVINGGYNGVRFYSDANNLNFNNFNICDPVQHGLYIKDASWLNLNNFKIDNAGSDGVYHSSGNNISFDNFKINNAGRYGFEIISTSDTTFSNCNIQKSTIYGIYLKQSHNFIIDACIVEYAGSTGIYFNHNTNPACNNFTIINCYIKNNNGDGIWLRHPDSTDLLITDNIFEGNVKDAIDDNTRIKHLSTTI